MASVQEVAQRLSETLFNGGFFKLADYERQGVPATSPAAADFDGEGLTSVPVSSTFATVSVVAVGYSDRRDQEHVYIYATRANQKLIRKFPPEIEGIPSSLVKFGNIDTRPQTTLTATNRPKCYTSNGRITCGSSTAPAGTNYAGTFGALVRKNGRLFALSNNHVFGECNHTPKSHPILCPSANDVGHGLPYPQTLFTQADLVPLHSGDPDHVPLCKMDASLAQVINENLVSSFQGTFYDTPQSVKDPEPQDLVKKVGRTTGLTHGFVEAKVAGPFILPYNSRRFKAVVYFTDVWLVRGMEEEFAAPGDSGSLVVTEDDEYSVGIVFAVDSQGLAVIAPLKPTLDYFQAEIVSGWGG